MKTLTKDERVSLIKKTTKQFLDSLIELAKEEKGVAWIAGFSFALAEVARLNGSPTVVREVARNAGVGIASAKKAGLEEYDLKELRKAGIR